MKRFGIGIRRVGTMTKRQVVLDLMRIAGYENDTRAFVRLLVENPVSRAVANEAWERGARARKAP